MKDILYEYTNYTNDYFDHLYNVEIMEYDMRNAGLSLCKLYKLLPESTIQRLERMDKLSRTIQLGIMQREDADFRKAHSQAFIDGRKLFFEANGLEEANVLSIKKDAIFTMKRCQHVEFNELVFVNKNRYTSFYKFGQYEYYYFAEGLDVKGISDDRLHLHADYMLSALHEFMYLMENVKIEKIIRYIKEFTYLYKTMQLSVGFYRELNSECCYRLKDFLEESYVVEEINDKSLILPNYNFNTYLTPLIDIVLRRA